MKQARLALDMGVFGLTADEARRVFALTSPPLVGHIDLARSPELEKAKFDRDTREFLQRCSVRPKEATDDDRSVHFAISAMRRSGEA